MSLYTVTIFTKLNDCQIGLSVLDPATVVPETIAEALQRRLDQIANNEFEPYTIEYWYAPPKGNIIYFVAQAKGKTGKKVAVELGYVTIELV